MQNKQRTASRIAGSAGTVGFGILISRVFGLIREQVLAGLFGAGFALDAFFVAYRIPGLLRDLFAQGALSPAVVTVFSQRNTKTQFKEALHLFQNLTTMVLLFGAIISIIGMFLSRLFVATIAPDFALVAEKLGLASIMCAVMFPAVVLVGLSTVAMGVLNSIGRFFIPSASSSLFNIGILGPGVLFSFYLTHIGYQPIIGIALGVLIGGAFQYAFQIPMLRKNGFKFKFRLDFKSAGIRQVGTLIIPAVMGLSANQINIFVNTFFATSCGEGSVTWLAFGNRIIMFPLGLVGISLATATLPLLGQFAVEENKKNFKEVISSSVVYSLLFSIPATFGIAVLSRPIVSVLFQHGAFTSDDTNNTASALSLYAVGLVALSVYRIFVASFYALEKAKYPVIGTLLSISLNVVFVFNTIDVLSFRAIALSNSICAFANILFLAVVLYKTIEGYPVKYIFVNFVKVFFSSALPALVIYYCYQNWFVRLGTGFIGTSAALCVSFLLYLIIYALLISAMKIDEVNLVRQKLFSRLKSIVS